MADKMDEFSNEFAKSFILELCDGKANFLDSKNILWKFVNGEWIGKPCVFINGTKTVWAEDIK